MPNCESELNREIGQRLQQIREGLGCTQEEFAEAIGVSVNYYRKLEYGQNALTLSRLVKLKKEKAIDLTYLLTGERTEFNFWEYLATIDRNKQKEVLYEVVDYAFGNQRPKKE